MIDRFTVRKSEYGHGVWDAGTSAWRSERTRQLAESEKRAAMMNAQERAMTAPTPTRHPRTRATAQVEATVDKILDGLGIRTTTRTAGPYDWTVVDDHVVRNSAGATAVVATRTAYIAIVVQKIPCASPAGVSGRVALADGRIGRFVAFGCWKVPWKTRLRARSTMSFGALPGLSYHRRTEPRCGRTRSPDGTSRVRRVTVSP
jgi:hypothetical protein